MQYRQNEANAPPLALADEASPEKDRCDTAAIMRQERSAVAERTEQDQHADDRSTSRHQHATEDRKLLPFRAYFQIEENAAQYVRASSLDFGNGEVTTTAIKGLGLDAESQEIYDLQGRRVHQPRKGELYIIGGQKKVY